MDNTYLQLRNIVSDVLYDGNTHDENAELNLLNLSLELLQRSSFDDLIYFFLPHLFLC